MKAKIKWAEESYNEIIASRVMAYQPSYSEVWLAGFEFAKIEIIKTLEKDYEWEREEIENVGEDEL